ncbi:MAG: undecaprenyl-diphosphate phosphatase [Clostridia bacterium]|nr:undecaprenyl-diphosphate phosphatase [Clostridia bacterium]
MLEYIKAIILGIVEGITEWLPISSTGHLILLGRLLDLSFEGADAELSQLLRSSFDVVIQSGAILAVVVLYLKRLLHAHISLYLKLAIATLPAGVVGILADKICEKYLGQSLDSLLFKPHVVAAALICYGILFILVERLMKSRVDTVSDVNAISFTQAFAIGCFQALAVIPGTSRSGSTVLGARILGIGRSAAAEFSFFAAIPVIVAASALKIYELADYTAERSVALPPSVIPIFALAGAVAFAVSMISIKFLTEFIKRHSFAPFGIYRILLGVIVLMLFK